MSWILDTEKHKTLIEKMLKSFIGGGAHIKHRNRQNFVGDILEITTSAGSVDIEFGLLKTKGPGQRKWRPCTITEISVTLKNKGEVEHDNSEDGQIVMIHLEDGDLYLTKKGYAGDVTRL